MGTRSIACLLICGVILMAVSPSKAFAQLKSRPDTASRVEDPSREPVRSKPSLKELFAREVAKNKAGAISEADLKRLEKGWLFPQAAPKPRSGFSKKKAVLVVVMVAAIVGLAVVLVHNGVDPVVRCEDEPWTPDCVQ